MSRRRWIGVGIAFAIVLAVSGYFLYNWLRKPPPEQVTHPPGQPNQRTARAEVPHITFTDVTASTGITFKHENGFSGYKLLPETMGGGVAIFDYDGDGKPDILFVNGCPWPGFGSTTADVPRSTPKMYRNLGNMKFEDVTAHLGLDVPIYGMGVAIGDYDNDGWPDVFISCVGENRLFRNGGDGRPFENYTVTSGVGGYPRGMPYRASKDEFLKWNEPIPFASSCTFLDYDGDGRLDLFVCYYITWSPAIDRSIASSVEGGKRSFVQPRDFLGAKCKLYRNIDGKHFEDVSTSAGIQVTEPEGNAPNAPLRPAGKSLGVVVCDPDNDGWPDLIVANDTTRNFFFHNVAGPDGKRRFVEKALQVDAAYAEEGKPRGGMGIDWGEFAPGRSAAVIANFANEALTVLEKDRTRLAFSDAAQVVGLGPPSRPQLKFGTFFFDYDNDGRLDLLVCNGHIEPEIETIQSSQRYAQPVQLFWNTGDAECYYEAALPRHAGEDLFKPMVGRGCAFADLDGDGDLDVVLVANGGPPRILRNDAPNTNHSVRLDLRGDGKTSSRSAIGALITVEAGGQTFTRQLTGGRGYLSQSELVITVGIGTATKADKVTVRWPGAAMKSELWFDLVAGQTHTLKQGEGK